MQRHIRTVLAILALTLPLAAISFAADDPSIKGKTRAGIQKAMQQHIEQHTVATVYPVYDVTDNKMRHLTLKELHSGIVKKGAFYVSCADFVDADGIKVDLDFLVSDDHGHFKTVETIVHKVDGTKRPYDLEN